jgi:hypothetical protein
LSGTVTGADSLSLVGADGELEPIIVAADGSWQKSVLLGVGPNPFQISAKKFLGSETSVTEQIFYQPTGSATTTATTSSTSSIPSTTSTTPTPVL